MRTLFFPLFLLLGTAQAAQPDCTTLLLTSTNLSYDTQAVFPTTPESKRVKFLDEDNKVGPLTLCGLTFTPDRKAGALQIAAKSFAAFSPLLGSLAPAGAKSQLTLENTFSTGSAFTLQTQSLRLDPVKRSLSYAAKPNGSIETTAAVKVDGGPLKPLYFNGKGTPLVWPKSASVLDVYVKTDEGGDLFWKRVRIDLKRPSLTIYERATMPSK